ncbi:MAG: glycosyltransferase [Lachnospiraceae bacterium]|nr:glycosyltransferase [Lachnospiraceae bacterium]
MEKRILISFVIPCYRSEETIVFVMDEIVRIVSERVEFDYEIIAVNDSSPDDVLDVLKEYADKNPNVLVVDCAQNRGKAAALMAGYSLGRGEYIVSLDDDGQSPTDQLWNLLAPVLDEDYDVSIARYPVKKESRLKRFGSWVNDVTMRVLIGKPKDLKFGNFFVFKRFVCEEMLRYKNPYPYIPGLYLRTSNRISNVLMEQRARKDEKKTGYTFWKSLSLWLNGFTSFSVKPLRITTVLGMAASGIGALFIVIIILRKVMNPQIQAGYSSVMATQLLIGGCILFSLGMIGEYVGRIYISLNNSPQYVIREIYQKSNLKETDTTG